MTVALFTHADCLGHDMGPGHPECADRLRAVLTALEGEAFAPLLREEAPLVAREDLLRAHPAEYVDPLLTLRVPSNHLLEWAPDVVVSDGSVAAIRRAAGGAVAAVDAVLDGWARAAFAAVRPPGHHAERSQAMGFCLFSNAAVAALHARARGVARVAVLDFDVHHGNGTQHILETDEGCFFGSSHQHPCYPMTGLPSETGVAGNVCNATLRPYSGPAEFRAAWAERILPAANAFAPDLVIISAGFDAHAADPLAELEVRVADFAWLTGEIVALADRHAGGRVASTLEGGYDLDALAASAEAHVRALMRLD